MSKFDPYEHLNIALKADGSIERLLHLPQAKATGDVEVSGSEKKVVSKDLVLNADNKTWIRVFRPTKLPSNDNAVAKLPIIIYFHGGGFIMFSVSDAVTHGKCENLSIEIPSIVVGVDYRLAPEHRLPAPYEDAIDAIQWVRKQALDQNGDPWLKNCADFSRCYLYGTSSGANVVFNAALKVANHYLEPLNIGGIIMNQPLIGGKVRTKSEIKLATDQYFPLPVMDLLWELSLPVGTDRDHIYCNPLVGGPIQDRMKKLAKCLIVGFGGDPLIDRQQDFVQMLVLSGVLVEARFDDVGFHGIDIIDKRRAAAIMSFVKEFV